MRVAERAADAARLTFVADNALRPMNAPRIDAPIDSAV